MINNNTPHLETEELPWDGQQEIAGGGGLQYVCGRPTLAVISALVLHNPAARFAWKRFLRYPTARFAWKIPNSQMHYLRNGK